jgi:hypothetical protein
MSFLDPANFAALRASWITLEDGRHILIVDSEVKFPSYGQAIDEVRRRQQKGWKVVESSKIVNEEMKDPKTGRPIKVSGRKWILENPETGKHTRVLSPHPLKK